MRINKGVLAVLGLAMLFGVAGCGGGGGGERHPVGTWNVIYDWNCDGSYNTTVFHIYDTGKFTMKGGASGVWNFSADALTLTFSAGTRFTGDFTDDDALSGTMSSPDGKDSGCWSATRTDANP